MGRTQRSLCAGMLCLQAVVVFLTTPVLLTLTDVATGVGLGIGLGLTVACVLAAGLMGRGRVGGALGWAVQLCSIALGVLLPVMVVLGLVFLGLYAASWVVGARIDRERDQHTAPGKVVG